MKDAEEALRQLASDSDSDEGGDSEKIALPAMFTGEVKGKKQIFLFKKLFCMSFVLIFFHSRLSPRGRSHAVRARGPHARPLPHPRQVPAGLAHGGRRQGAPRHGDHPGGGDAFFGRSLDFITTGPFFFTQMLNRLLRVWSSAELGVKGEDLEEAFGGGAEDEEDDTKEGIDDEGESEDEGEEEKEEDQVEGEGEEEKEKEEEEQDSEGEGEEGEEEKEQDGENDEEEEQDNGEKEEGVVEDQEGVGEGDDDVSVSAVDGPDSTGIVVLALFVLALTGLSCFVIYRYRQRSNYSQFGEGGVI